MIDALGDRIKNQYESRSQTYLPRRTYTMIRLDGCHFHTYTKKLVKPFDYEFIDDMNETAKHLAKNIQGCKIAYVQSDEITLLLSDFDSIETDAWFNGNVQKIVSVSASMASAKFNQLRSKRESFDPKNIGYFDARCFVIPDREEVLNAFIWRQKDCLRNSISMISQNLFSAKQLHGKSVKDRTQMIVEKQFKLEEIPLGWLRGRFVIKNTTGFINNSKERWIIEEEPPVLTENRDWFWAATGV